MSELRLAVVAGVVALVVSAGDASAQQVLNPLSGDFTVGTFNYSPPISDGWRELSKGPSGLELVYVEGLADGQINSRAHLVLESSKVPENAEAPDPEVLTRLSRDQQIEARKDVLVGKTDISRVPGDADLYRYTLTTRGGEITLIEAFFVLLARDRSEYVVAKLATREPDYEKSPYFPDFYGSLASLKRAGVSVASESGATSGGQKAVSGAAGRPSEPESANTRSSADVGSGNAGEAP